MVDNLKSSPIKAPSDIKTSDADFLFNSIRNLKIFSFKIPDAVRQWF